MNINDSIRKNSEKNKEEKLKKALLLIIILVLFLFLSWDFVAAQEFGSVKGVVKDVDGAPLPGVTVTLTGSKIVTMTDISSEGGHFRFLKLPVASDYTLKIQLPGFKTITREKLGVSFGKDVILNITMEMGALEEEVTAREIVIRAIERELARR